MVKNIRQRSGCIALVGMFSALTGASKYHGWIVKKIELSSAWGTFEIADFLKKSPVAKQAQEETPGDARIVHNEAQGGVEIYFTAKPSSDIIADIKGNSFRWSMRNKCWYRRISPSAIKVAAKYGELPETLLQTA